MIDLTRDPEIEAAHGEALAAASDDKLSDRHQVAANLLTGLIRKINRQARITDTQSERLSRLVHITRIDRDLGLVMLRGHASGELKSLEKPRQHIYSATGYGEDIVHTVFEEESTEASRQMASEEFGASLTASGRLAAYNYVIGERIPYDLEHSLDVFTEADRHLSRGKNPWYTANNAIRAAMSAKLSPGKPIPDQGFWIDLAKREAMGAEGSTDGELAAAAVKKARLFLWSGRLTRLAIKKRP